MNLCLNRRDNPTITRLVVTLFVRFKGLTGYRLIEFPLHIISNSGLKSAI